MPSALVGRPGEDVEAVVSMLLCRRYERAARRRPGQGDRGVDVFVPLTDGRIDVYQVKRYDRSLNSSQWRKIKESYQTLVKAVAEGRFAVRNWYLVMPLDESDADSAKLAALVADAPFELCEWKGLAWLDALASEFPSVVDYYLGDGKARLESAHGDLMAVLNARDAAAAGADAVAVGDGLAGLHRALNRHDALYRYDFAVGATAERDLFVPVDPPTSLVFTAQVSNGGVCVTWHVYARCDESVRERPIPIGLLFDADDNPELQESLRLFSEYGKPFEAPDRTVTITTDLPGGLGGGPHRGSVQIGPTAQDAAREYGLRLRACHAGAPHAVVRLVMNAPTVGSRGARLSGEHDGGAFAFEALHDVEPPRMHIQFMRLELTGKAVASVLVGVEFLRGLPGATLEVAAEHGPFMPFGEAPSVGECLDDSGDAEIAALRALQELQQHTATTVLVPDFSVVTVGQLREWQVIARMLRGEAVSDRRLGVLTTVLEHRPEAIVDGDHAFAFTTDLVAAVGEQRLLLGQQLLHIDAATVRTDAGEPARLAVTPWRGHSWTRTRVEPPV
jgi:hypothetical protein